MYQVIVPGWMTRIGDKLIICTKGFDYYPKGVLIIPDDRSYRRFINNSWYD